jgi:hypothetical protein
MTKHRLLLQGRVHEVDNASLRLDEARRKHYKGAQKELKVGGLLHPADAAAASSVHPAASELVTKASRIVGTGMAGQGALARS